MTYSACCSSSSAAHEIRASVPTHSFASHGKVGEGLFCAVAFENDGLGRRGPYEGFWVRVSMIEPFDDGGLEFGNAAEDASAYSLASDLGEQTLNEIEPGRGCRGEVQLEARMTLEPTLHGRRLVCGVIVEDQVEVETRQRLFVDPPQEFQEFLGTMARQAFTDDLASCNVERGEQRRSPMTLIVVRHGAGTAFLEGQARLRAIQGLDLALLVDGKHQRFIGRIEVEADDILHLLGEVWVVGGLKGANEMGLEPVRLPDALHAGMADAYLLSHHAHAPMRGIGRAFLGCLFDNLELDGVGDRLLAGRFGPSLDQAGHTSLDKVVLPAPNGRLRYPDRAHDRHHPGTVSRHEYNLGAFDDLLRDIPVPQYPFQPGAIPCTENECRLLLHHAARESYSRRCRIQLFVTKH